MDSVLGQHHLETSDPRTLDIPVTGDGHPGHPCNTYPRHQSLEYIETKTWRLELGEIAAN